VARAQAAAGITPEQAAQLRLEWRKGQAPRDAEAVKLYCKAWVIWLLDQVFCDGRIDWTVEYPSDVLVRMCIAWRNNPEFERQMDYGK
jgi:hypothetical protein